MMKIKIFILIVFAFGLGFVACTDKLDLGTLPNSDNEPGNITGDTVYVQLNPAWTGFNKPEDILIGREPFIYVADTKNDRIVMMDISGKVLGTKMVKNPVALAQDFKLNLIVCGELEHNGETYSAVFRINLYDARHNIHEAKVDTLLPKNSFDFSRNDRVYTGVCVFADNKFYVSRKGPKNDLISPDNAILYSSTKYLNDGTKIDTINNIDKIAGFQPLGTGLLSSNQISSLTSMNDNTFDIVVTLIAPDASFKVQWLTYIESQEFAGYVNKIDVNADLMQFGKFGKPEGCTIDRKGNLYIADAEKDSVFKFNPFGDELESFGGPDVFDSPHAVAHFDNTLYVLDTNNDRILRYILSTDNN